VDEAVRIITKVLYTDHYKDGDAFDAALERWKEKGWNLADIAQDLKKSDDAAAILWRSYDEAMNEEIQRINSKEWGL
jgi:hypothetical protein